MKRFDKELLENAKVLYIEDEEIIRNEVVFFLSKYIKEFHFAKNGEEGIEIFNKVKPDLLITDIQMPKMNGLEMIRELDTKDCSVIVTTAHSDAQYFLDAIELDVKKFIIKPMDLYDLMLSIQECIQEQNLKNKLFEKDNLLKIVDENVLISVTDLQGNIIQASKAFCELTQYPKEELLGNRHNILRHEDTPLSFYEDMWERIHQGEIFKSEIKNRKKNGEVYWANLTITPVYKDNKIINFTAVRQDITNKKILEELSIKDYITKLYNRRYFNEVIEREIRRNKRENTNLSLIILDVDYFKNYNDTYGHPKGDEVLVQVANTLKKYSSRASDYAFRIGGEEFAIISSGMQKDESLKFIEEIVKSIEELNIEHKASACSKYVTISAGIVVQNGSNMDCYESLYKYCDDALYEAKQEGRNQARLAKESH